MFLNHCLTLRFMWPIETWRLQWKWFYTTLQWDRSSRWAGTWVPYEKSQKAGFSDSTRQAKNLLLQNSGPSYWLLSYCECLSGNEKALKDRQLSPTYFFSAAWSCYCPKKRDTLQISPQRCLWRQMPSAQKIGTVRSFASCLSQLVSWKLRFWNNQIFSRLQKFNSEDT